VGAAEGLPAPYLSNLLTIPDVCFQATNVVFMAGPSPAAWVHAGDIRRRRETRPGTDLRSILPMSAWYNIPTITNQDQLLGTRIARLLLTRS
jgi:hypothetical protein